MMLEKCISGFKYGVILGIYPLSKTNGSPLKNDGWKTIVPFEIVPISGDFRSFSGEGKCLKPLSKV